jgi:hypothetical protein
VSVSRGRRHKVERAVRAAAHLAGGRERRGGRDGRGGDEQREPPGHRAGRHAKEEQREESGGKRARHGSAPGALGGQTRAPHCDWVWRRGLLLAREVCCGARRRNRVSRPACKARIVPPTCAYAG